jgi:ParB family chromosome partitioning protein
MWDMHDRLGDNIDLKSCAPLIDSIQRHGQKQPVLGRASAARGDCEYELIYGARRLFVAQHLGIDLLVDVRELDNNSGLIEMDIENRVRVDISPYERGRSYRRWLAAGYFQNQALLAKALAVSEAQVSRLLRYAELPAVVVDAFQSPNDIREEWAVSLAKLCAEPSTRSLVMNRARIWSSSARSVSPQTVFDALVNGRGPQSPPECRSRDDVVKDADGRPLYRVGFRAKSVHLIIARQKVSQVLLQEINQELKRILVTASDEREVTTPLDAVRSRKRADGLPLATLRANRSAG